jgi:hypothetical protein
MIATLINAYPGIAFFLVLAVLNGLWFFIEILIEKRPRPKYLLVSGTACVGFVAWAISIMPR